MAKEYVPIFFDWLDTTQDLTAEEKGNLIDSIVLYAATGCEPFGTDDDVPKVFQSYKERVDAERDFNHGKPNGKYHWNWKGGITPQNQKERSSGRYAQWRMEVFSRDHFTCQICKKVGGKLNAHHIEGWAEKPSLRFDVNNGITLCEKCHAILHRKDVKK